MTRGAARVVLDTNVVISALVFSRGRLPALRQAWQRLQILPLASRATIAELMRTLMYPKFKLTEEDQRELVADYLPFCTVIDVPARVPQLPQCRDPFDVPFLELALTGEARFLVTGDKDLLGLNLPGCQIVSPDCFLRVLAGGHR